MEKNDQSNNGPEVSVKTFGEEKERASSGGPLKAHWGHSVKGIMEKSILIFKTLWGKTKSLYRKILKSDGEQFSPLEDIKGAFRHIPFRRKGLGGMIVGFLVGIYLLSGVYTVRPGEEAVARVFGKEVRHAITEGLHYRLPWPFEAVEKVNVMEIRRVDVGVTSSNEPLLFPKKRSNINPSTSGGHGGHGALSGAPKAPAPNPVSAKNQFLTGDENILDIRMNIQYRIKDTSDYLFNFNSPDSLVPYASRVAVTEIIGEMLVDDLLTTAKSQIQKRIALKAQRLLDQYKTGLYIVNVSLQEVNPPKEVARAFRDVSSAREEREEKINKAQGYRNSVIPEARGKAHKLISDAEGYREEVINRASGDADKFSTMLKEYRRATDVTEYRLYLETIEKVLAKAKKFVIDSKKEKVNLKFVK